MCKRSYFDNLHVFAFVVRLVVAVAASFRDPRTYRTVSVL